MTPHEIDDLVFRVYMRRLDDSWPGDAEMALKRDGHKKMQGRANIWKPLITAVLMELGLHEKQRGPKHEVQAVKDFLSKRGPHARTVNQFSVRQRVTSCRCR